MRAIALGQRVLITTDCWFIAPDGHSYKAAWGTVVEILDSQETLGVRTNARSTNWYVQLGNMLIAGCQIHYAIACENPNFEKVKDPYAKDPEAAQYVTMIYNADQDN